MTDASTYVAALSEALKLKVIPLSGQMKARYGKEFKSAISKEVSEQELYTVVERIASEWERTQLTVGQALRDVRNGTPSLATKQTPQERTEGYEYLFKLSPRQQRILERIGTVGKEQALKAIRGQLEEVKKAGAA